MRAKTQRFELSALRVCLAAVLYVGSVSAGPAWKGYLSLEGFKGESKDPDHKDWSEVTGFNEASSVAGSWGALGKPIMEPLVITRTLDQASPGLYARIAQGQTIGSAVLHLVRSDAKLPGQVADLLKIELKDVLIVGITTASGSAGGVAETLRLVAREVTVNSITISVGPLAGGARQAALASAMLAGGGPLPSSTGTTSTASEGSSVVLLQNLLRNPGAEASPGSSDLLAMKPPLDWTTTGGLTALRYSALSGAGDSGVDHGYNLFSGSPENELNLASQVVDVSSAARQIDEGKLQAVLSGWLSAGSGEQEIAHLRAFFRDTLGKALGSLEVASTPSASQVSGLLERHESTGNVPSGARSIEVVVELHRYTGTGGGSVADDLSLIIQEIPAQSAGAPLRIQVQRFTGSADQPSVQVSWLADAGAVVIESAERIDGAWRLESPPTKLKNAQRSFEIPIESNLPLRFWRVRPVGSLQ